MDSLRGADLTSIRRQSLDKYFLRTTHKCNSLGWNNFIIIFALIYGVYSPSDPSHAMRAASRPRPPPFPPLPSPWQHRPRHVPSLRDNAPHAPFIPAGLASPVT